MMALKPIYIFDLDGTLANIEHRVHILQDKTNRNRWDEFYRACVNDVPVDPVVATMAYLQASADIWIVTGRSADVRDLTLRWLADCTTFRPDTDKLVMRASKDHRPDDVLKETWLQEQTRLTRHRIVGVFEDRARVVEMWRRNGLVCFQVAPGDF